jgi:hypothetical protein
VIDGRNVLVLGTALPAELAADRGSLAVDPSVFRDPGAGDYRLVAGSSPIDRGIAVDVATDRDGVARPQGAGHDVGAYEHCEGDCAPAPDGGAGGGGGAGGAGCCRVDGGGARWWTVLAAALWLCRRRRRPQGRIAPGSWRPSSPREIHDRQ